MDTFALRSIRRQYGSKEIPSQDEKGMSSSNLKTSAESANHTGRFDTYQIEALKESSGQKSSISLLLASPFSVAKTTHEIKNVTLQEKRAVVDEKKNISQTVAPSFTDLDQLRRGDYKNCINAAIDQFFNYCDFYFNSPLDLAEDERATPLNQEFGFTGLSNHHGTCYLNAALQFTAQVVRTIEGEGSSVEREMLQQHLVRLSHFSQFVHGELKINDEQRALYREVSCEVSKSFWFREGGPSLNQLQTGFKRLGHSASYIEHLLTQVKVPQIRFQKNLQGKEKCYDVRILYDGQLDEFTQLQDPTSSTKLIGEVPSCFVRKKTLEEKKEKPIRAIRFFHQDSHGRNTSITFIPKAALISTVIPNHAFCCIQKDGAWHEINDSLIKKIPKEWEEGFTDFMAKNGAMILYERQIDSVLAKTANDHHEFPQEEAIEGEESIQPAFDLNSIPQQWKDYAAKMSKQSFYYHRCYQQLLKLEGKRPAPSLLTLREQFNKHREQQEQLQKVYNLMKRAW